MNMRAPFVVASLVVVLAYADAARAMCGCMLRPRPPPKSGTVAQAKIVNKASKVVLVRDGDATTMTLANDFVDAPVEFGLVIPVPTVIQKKDVKIVDDTLFTDLEKQTAPRLVEEEDPDPCANQDFALDAPSARGGGAAAESAKMAKPRLRASDYGVKVESHFFAGEYELAVLSGTDSGRLVEWLQKLDYDVPDDAATVLGSYIKQKMFFLVARVHVKEMGNKARFLRPIQITYASPKFMLPVRLGMVNADGPQELMVFALSKQGRIEPTNYRALRLPTGQGELPAYVKHSFDAVYTAAFTEATRREDMRVVFIEASLPIANASGAGGDVVIATDAVKKSGAKFLGGARAAAGWVTRMHFRYDKAGFPEDLVLQETTDQAGFLARFRSRKHHLGPARCPAHAQYLSALPPILDREAQVLANLTGWTIEDVRAKLPKVTP